MIRLKYSHSVRTVLIMHCRKYCDNSIKYATDSDTK